MAKFSQVVWQCLPKAQTHGNAPLTGDRILELKADRACLTLKEGQRVLVVANGGAINLAQDDRMIARIHHLGLRAFKPGNHISQMFPD